MRGKILILGKGFIGSRLQAAFGCAMCADKIYSLKDAQNLIRKYSPKTIINCIGHTGSHNVDDCELDKDATLLANSFIPVILAEACLRDKVKLVHISSGCIYHYDYHKDMPIKEERIPDFLELYYSRSKIYAERAIEVLAGEYGILIVRIRIPLDDRPHPRNILTKLIQFKKAIDIPNSVTYLPDFILALKHLLKINARGTYNVVNRGALRYPEFLDLYKKYVPDFRYKRISYSRLGLVRSNLLLSVRKLEKSGFKMRKIEDTFAECLENYLKY